MILLIYLMTRAASHISKCKITFYNVDTQISCHFFCHVYNCRQKFVKFALKTNAYA